MRERGEERNGWRRRIGGQGKGMEGNEEEGRGRKSMGGEWRTREGKA